MFKSASATHAVHGQLLRDLPPQALTLQTPVQFDPALTPRLIAAHGALNARFATLMSRLGSDPEAAAGAVRDCADQLRDLRRSEALWLYPVIARGVEIDADARRKLAQLRLAMQSRARRVLRRFEELARAIQTREDATQAAEEASTALAEYLSRNEAEIYPLYGLRRPSAARAA